MLPKYQKWDMEKDSSKRTMGVKREDKGVNGHERRMGSYIHKQY